MRKFLVSIATIAALVIFADAASARTFALTGTFSRAQVKKRCGAAYESHGGSYGCSVPCKGGTCAVGCKGGKCTGKVPTQASVTPGAPSTSGPKDALEAALMGIEPAKKAGAVGGKLTQAVALRRARLGGGGLGFECGDILKGFCSCTGGRESADCKAMAKNCETVPITCPPDNDDVCACTHKPLTNVGSRDKNFRVPMGGGLLDADRGMPSGGGAAPTGAPAAPRAPAAPAGRIN